MTLGVYLRTVVVALLVTKKLIWRRPGSVVLAGKPEKRRELIHKTVRENGPKIAFYDRVRVSWRFYIRFAGHPRPVAPRVERQERR